MKMKFILCIWFRLLFFFNSEFAISNVVYAEQKEANGLPSIGKLRSSADTLYTNGKYDESIEVWNQVIALEPNNDSNFYKRFRVYLRQQKYKEAMADLNSVISINPKHENAVIQRAKLHLKLGRCSEAVNDFDQLKR